MTRPTRSGVALLTALVLSVGFGACGGDPKVGTGLTGDIDVDGSSTVAPLTEAVAEEYRTEESEVNVVVGTSGTGGGFKRFCAGEIDIADASRPIKDEEVAVCQEHGVAYTEVLVGLDGLAIVTSAENDFLECLSFEQLAAIFKDDGADRWSDVDPKLPNDEVEIFAPGSDSGTYDFFVEEILGKPDDPGSIRPRTDYTASEDDNTLVQGLAGERASWGFFGFAYLNENAQVLKPVAVREEADGECVDPTDESVADGTYPLSRPLYIYVKNSELVRPEVRDFLGFYLEITPELIVDVGFVAAPASAYEKGRDALEQAAA